MIQQGIQLSADDADQNNRALYHDRSRNKRRRSNGTNAILTELDETEYTCDNVGYEITRSPARSHTEKFIYKSNQVMPLQTHSTIQPTTPKKTNHSTILAYRKKLTMSQRELRDFNFIIDPHSRFKFIFDLFVFVAIMYLSLETPYFVATNNDDINTDATNPFFWLDRILDFLFILDIILNFFTAIDVGNGIELLCDRKKIAACYLKGWFAVDFISSIPLDAILLALSSTQTNFLSVTRLLKISKIIKIIKILRIVRLQRLKQITTKHSVFASAGLRMLFESLKYIIMILFLGHWMSCAYLLILEQGPEDEDPLADLDGIDRYVAALYFTFTYLSTVGFGDFSPLNTYQRAFMVFGLTVGSFLTTYFLSAIVHLVALKNTNETRKKIMANRTEEFLIYKGLPNDLRKRILEYTRTLNDSTFGDEQMVLNMLSPPLRKEVLYHSNKRFIRKIPYLQNVERPFVEQIGLLLRSCYYANGDLIMRSGEFDDKLYFIQLGVCKLFADHESKHMAYKSLYVGEYFGESSLIKGEFCKEYNVEALSWTGVLTLTRDDFLTELEMHPRAAKQIREWLKKSKTVNINHSKNQWGGIEGNIDHRLNTMWRNLDAAHQNSNDFKVSLLEKQRDKRRKDETVTVPT